MKRAIYHSKLDIFKQQGYPVVYMDESGFEYETIRSHGYTLIGTPCIDSYNWQGKKRTNVIGALYEKIIRVSVFKSYLIGMVIVFYGCHPTALI